METVLNVGLCSATIPGLIEKTGNERFVYDAYRRLIMMYSDVVMEKAEDIEPAEGKGIRVQLEHIMDELKKPKRLQVRHRPDGRRPQEALRAVQGEGQGSARPRVPRRSDGAALGRHRRGVQELERQAAPSPIAASKAFRDEWGTAVNVQSMVFGNMGDTLGHRRGLHRATRPPARTSSTANGWSTPRAKTWWPASARRTR